MVVCLSSVPVPKAKIKAGGQPANSSSPAKWPLIDVCCVRVFSQLLTRQSATATSPAAPPGESRWIIRQWPVFSNCPSTKLKEHNVLPCHQRRAELQPQVMCTKKLTTSETLNTWILRYASRQTNLQTQARCSQYFASMPARNREAINECVVIRWRKTDEITRLKCAYLSWRARIKSFLGGKQKIKVVM